MNTTLTVLELSLSTKLKDGDMVRTVVNHFHGFSSSTEVHRNVSGQIGVTRKFWNFNKCHMRDEETNTLFKCTVFGLHVLHKWARGGVPFQSGQLEHFIRVAREVIQSELQEWCFDPKRSNSRLVQV